ncbi:ABC transporter permease [Leucobacter insecticola]|uniref:ABC transporter permease n=1 Tax=Leucobacter insecticola TaxID=2714934 RepID=A0A6G8FJA8_9MICO|nr:ABC transporter permease [Leucobacter insecticola]QIM16455.1 ABC transporter permease [Leucobacter insecticola]
MSTQLQEFTRTHTRELLRDKNATVVILASFLGMLGMFWILDLVISGATGEPTMLLKRTFVMVSFIGFMGIAFGTTTVPLVRYRSLGTLRQLSTTPARVSAFLLGHVPVRAGLVAAESIIVVAVMLTQGVSPLHTLQAIVTLLLGGLLLLALGYLVAARLKNPNVALQLTYLAPMFVLASSGAMIPLSVYPGWLESVCRFLPTTWFADALNAQITGSAPALPLGIAWLLLAFTTAAFAALAARLMRLS